MTQYNTLNVKVSNSQLNKLKSRKKNGTKLTFEISSNVVGNSNDVSIFSHKLLLTNRQVSRLRIAFANNFSTDIKLSKTQLHNRGQSGGFLNRLLDPLLKTKFPLIRSVLKSFAKSVLVPLGLTAAVSVIDVAIRKEKFRSGMTILIISNKEMNDITKVVRSLDESGVFIKGVSERIKMKQKNKKADFSVSC